MNTETATSNSTLSEMVDGILKLETRENST
jgi:hypothetical protein